MPRRCARHPARPMRLVRTPVLALTILCLALWPISFWRAPNASIVHASWTPGPPDPPAVRRALSLSIAHGSVRLAAERTASTAMGLMGWGILQPGWEGIATITRTSPRDTSLIPDPAHSTPWRTWFGGGFRFRTTGPPQSTIRIAAPLWAIAAALGASALALTMADARRRRVPHLCAECAFDLRGLPTGAPCPECGRTPT